MSNQIFKTNPRTHNTSTEHKLIKISGAELPTYYPSSITLTDTFEGVKNPRWKYQVRKGLNATTEMSGIRFPTRPWYFYGEEFWNWNNGGKPKYTGSKTTKSRFVFPFTGLVPGTISLTSADNEAKSMYVKKVRDFQTTFGGSVFAAELLQTIRLIKNPASALRGKVFNFEKGLRRVTLRRSFKRLPKKDKIKILADTWLEYSFGWSPLINDVDDALKAVADAQYATDPELFKTFGYGEDNEVILRGVVSLGATQPIAEIRYRLEKRASVKYLGAWDFSTYALTNQRTGFDMSNWGLAAWEIVPWSFLIDYFSNIGDIISALTLARSGERWTSRTTRQEYRYVAESSTKNLSNLYSNGSVVASTWVLRTPDQSHIYVTRKDHTGRSLVPSVEFSLPGSNRRWLNITALLASRDWAKSAFLTD